MLQRRLLRYFVALGVTALAISSLLLFGANTKFWTSATYEDFAPGNFSGISLNREGTMTLAPQLKEVFSTDQAVVWAVARDSKGNIYLGTGHSGKVFKLGPDLKGSVFFEASEPDIFALAVDQDNHVYAGTSPDGKVYKIDGAGKGEVYFDPHAKYIWAMTFSPDGALYVGTGDRGKIYRIAKDGKGDGKGDLFYDTHQTHVMSLALAPGSSASAPRDLIAGSEPNGLLYRISPAGKAFVLYDSPLSEIHGLAVSSDGAIYASALGSAEDRRLRTPPAQGIGTQSPVQATTSITVRAQQGSGLPGEGGSADGEQRPGAATSGDQPSVSVGQVFSTAGARTASRGTKSALYRIAPDGNVDTLWSSPRENVFDLLPSGKNLLFSTDEKGRIYELTPDRRASLVTETDEEETTRLIPYQNLVLAATANLGKLFSVGTEPADTGYYESEVRDTGGVSAWGHIRWTADSPAGTALELFTRSGNSGRPDATWSDWSGPYRQNAGDQIGSPPARYVQWKAVFHSASARSPLLDSVTVPYLPRNQAPTVTDLKVVSRAEKALGSSAGSAGTGASAPRGLAGFAAALRSTPPRGFDISWTGSDPDQDELAYSLYFKGEGESEWKLLQGDLKQNYFQFESDLLPDGKYRLKIVASDAGANPAALAKTAEMISAPFTVDNAPPQVEVKEAKRSAGSATARFRAFDAISVLTRAEYALDAGAPVPLLSDDGIVDSAEETFTVVINPLDGREHLLTLRVYDSAGNMGVAKALWPSSAGNEK
jgi:sugar lactone lactonase YvrE